MTKHLRASAAVALSALAMLSLDACNGGANSINPFTPSRGTLRFINASPDAGAVDVAIGKAGQPNFSNVAYAGTTSGSVGISQYVPFNAPTQLIYVYPAGQDSTQIPLNLSSVTIVPNGRITVLLVGEKANNTLKLVFFTEHLFTTASGSASVSFHHAAPSVGSTTYSVGYTPISSLAQLNPIGTISYPSNQPTFKEGIDPTIASAGISFYAQGGGKSLTITPSQVDPNNTGNVMPFNFNGNANTDQNLSIYLIDGPVVAGAAHPPQLIGVFDPDN